MIDVIKKECKECFKIEITLSHAVDADKGEEKQISWVKEFCASVIVIVKTII